MIREDENFTLGSGRIQLALLDDNGRPRAFRRIGDTPGYTLSVESTRLEKWGSDGELAELRDEAVTRITREGTIQLENIVPENVALFLNADTEEVEEAGDSVTDEEIADVELGGRYLLGVDADNPAGVRGVENVAGTASDGTTALVEGTDFEVDGTLGEVRILPGATEVAEGDSISFDYDIVASTRTRVITRDTAMPAMALMFQAANTRGTNRDLFAPNVQLRPSGELAFKDRENWQRLEFNVSYRPGPEGAAVYIENRPVA